MPDIPPGRDLTDTSLDLAHSYVSVEDGDLSSWMVANGAHLIRKSIVPCSPPLLSLPENSCGIGSRML